MHGRRIAASILALLGTACQDWFEDSSPSPTTTIPKTDGDGFSTTEFGGVQIDPFAGMKIGEACTLGDGGYSDCRAYLQCVNGSCRAVGNKVQGTYCITNGECAEALYCNIAGQCSPAGAGEVGSSCGSGENCKPQFHCQAQGLVGTCSQAGTSDVKGPCVTTSDCFAPLQCNLDTHTCDAINLAHGWRPWTGATCDLAEDTGPARPYFVLPRNPPTEFFRLPFPNDAAKRDGKVNLDGFPTPGQGVIGFDPVKRVVDAVEATQTGFSTIPAVVFRFSKNVDWQWLQSNGGLHYYDITPGISTADGYGQKLGYSWGGNNGFIDNYSCQRTLVVKSERHRPLAPGHVYAAFVTGELPVEGTAGADTFEPDADFAAMMSDAQPTDALGADAWKAYAPLRAFLDDTSAGHGLVRGNLIVGTVFTVQDTQSLYPALRTAVHATPLPTPTQLMACDGQAVSPCDDGLTGDAHVRGCLGVSVSAAAYELHAKVSIPIIQQGTRPYLTEGGQVALDAAGMPVIQGQEEVCISLTVPKQVPMPAEGWPVLFSFHGTGGTFRSSVDGIGIDLADVDSDGKKVGLVTVGMDGPMHGSRRGQTDLTPDVLFYNFANPPAARGNLYQGAADVFAIVRAIRAWVVLPAQSPTGQEIRFNPKLLGIMGHSQGSSTGPLAAPYESDLVLSIWSGAGAGLAFGLVGKLKPVDVKQGLAVALQEYTSEGLREVVADHPVLGLIQTYFDPVDPLNHLAHLITSPVGSSPRQHVLHIYGLGDSYTPVSTQKLFARVLGVEHVKPVLEEIPATTVDAPVYGNLGSGTITGVVIQAKPDANYDGHFVAFFNQATHNQFRHFVGSWLATGVPRAVAP
jgi:hypothetical protein